MSVLFSLPGLNDIDWSSLHHAYGPATGTADDLRGLTSADSAVRCEALQQLEMSICHQSSLYSATALAIPFLLTAAENLTEGEQAETRTFLGGDLLGLIECVVRSASSSPGWIAESVYQSWTLWPDSGELPAPRELAVSEINVYRASLKACMDNWDRVSILLGAKKSELLSQMAEAARLTWAGDLGHYVRSLRALSAGVVQTVLAEPVEHSYKALAKRLDPMALAPAILWWALEDELSGDTITLAQDSLARDLTEHVRRGWKTGLHHARQTERFWRIWSLRFIKRPEAVTRVRQFLDENAQHGWLPQSREADLIVAAVAAGFQ